MLFDWRTGALTLISYHIIGGLGILEWAFRTYRVDAPKHEYDRWRAVAAPILYQHFQTSLIAFVIAGQVPSSARWHAQNGPYRTMALIVLAAWKLFRLATWFSGWAAMTIYPHRVDLHVWTWICASFIYWDVFVWSANQVTSQFPGLRSEKTPEAEKKDRLWAESWLKIIDWDSF
ncbi:hypothetical protein K461DRAFT_271066 [Myriangium duriaei CBS 260.36]|uniref:Uncharacterized protein n=1 Tax=Myriangium duriaei CBS 260.36 TaxID=1168546 RepID=A0A9P4IXD4_9PEZI|nr:hypothetical protein K461DRAFT_271066 [Myriangium duriaei CBS 260.36]